MRGARVIGVAAGTAVVACLLILAVAPLAVANEVVQWNETTMKVIEAKAEGTPLRKAAGRPKPGTNVSDLVARLRESLAAAERGGAATRASAPAKPPAASAKRRVTRRAATKPRKRVA